MERFLTLLIATFSLAFFLSAQNLVRNSGFEEGPQGGWGHFMPAESNEVDCRMGVDGPGRGGRQAAWIDAPAFARHAILQNLGNISNGERFRLSAWTRIDGKTLLEKRTPGVLVRLNFLGSNGLSVKDARGLPMAAYGWLGGRQCRLIDIDKITLPPTNPAAASSTGTTPSARAATLAGAKPISNAAAKAIANVAPKSPGTPDPKAVKSATAPLATPLKPANTPAKPVVPPPPPPHWIPPGTNWARIDLVCEAPPGSAVLELGLFAWWMQGRVWFDDISVERTARQTALTPFFNQPAR